MPGVENCATVFSCPGVEKVTVPGPAVLVHVVVIFAGGLGRPSSLAVPFKVILDGKNTTWSGPALTVGAVFSAAFVR